MRVILRHVGRLPYSIDVCDHVWTHQMRPNMPIEMLSSYCEGVRCPRCLGGSDILVEKVAPDVLGAPAAGRHGIYIASKTVHASRWRYLRDNGLMPIVSTWIDEAGAGESQSLEDLWRRCILESATAEVLVIYREHGEILKGAFVELGAALAAGVPVLAVGIEELSVSSNAGVRPFLDLKDAMAEAGRIIDENRALLAQRLSGSQGARLGQAPPIA